MNLDAYTIRKIAPRLLIAVIGVNLSIYLCVAAIDITNIIGGGIGDMLRAPFSNLFGDIGIEGNALNEIVGVVGVGGVTLAGLGIAGVGGVAGAAASSGFLATLAGGAIATAGGAVAAVLMFLLIAMAAVVLISVAVLATLVIRYGAIIFLTIISPIAIACWVLPGTEKYFRQWWDIFQKVLIVYPIIAVIFAISDILAALFLATAPGKDDASALVAIFVTIFAVYAPLFMIPFAFKLAGGIIGAVYDFANQRGVTPLNEGIKKWKQDPESWYAQAANKRKENRVGRGFTARQVSSSTFAGLSALRSGGGLSGFRETYGARSRRIGAQKARVFKKQAAEREAYGLFEGDDDIAKAAYYGGSREQIESNLIRQSIERFGDGHGGEFDTPDRIRARKEATDLIMNLQSQLGTDSRKQLAAEEYAKATTSFKGEAGAAEAFELAQGASSSSLGRTRSLIDLKTAQKGINRELGLASTAKLLGMQKDYEDIQALAESNPEEYTARMSNFRDKVIDSAIEKSAPSQIGGMDNNGLRQVVKRSTARLQLAHQGITFDENGKQIQLAEGDIAGRDQAIQRETAHLAKVRDAINYFSPENTTQLEKVFSESVGEVMTVDKRDAAGNRIVIGQDNEGKPKYATENRQLTVKELVEQMESSPGQNALFATLKKSWGGDLEEVRRRGGAAPGSPDQQ